jgi:NAD(P)-dependent dehydrogenase (short-subunit alcohol dehydrogenase family)
MNAFQEAVMGKHDGKVAVVTGGTSGIGLATAARLAEEGAHVFITGRRQKEIDAAVRKLGPRVTGVQGDVANLEDLDRLYETVKREKGHIDILFANAGSGEFAPLGLISEEHFDKIFDANVKGLLFTVQKALPIFKDGGSIILNASIAASKGLPSFSVYNATKAAVRSFARSWTNDLRSRRIRVNAVSPGVVPTPGYTVGLKLDEKQVDEFVQGMLPQIPAGRAGTTDEVAKVVSFLASDESSYVTGVELFVDGGLAQI